MTDGLSHHHHPWGSSQTEMGVPLTLPEPWCGPGPPTLSYLTTTWAWVLGQTLQDFLDLDASYLLTHPHRGYSERKGLCDSER